MNEESLLLCDALQRATAPDQREKIADTLTYSSPRVFVVRFEHHPLCAYVDGFFYKAQYSTHVDVTQ